VLNELSLIIDTGDLVKAGNSNSAKQWAGILGPCSAHVENFTWILPTFPQFVVSEQGHILQGQFCYSIALLKIAGIPVV
jgi:hypothetical protein